MKLKVLTLLCSLALAATSFAAAELKETDKTMPPLGGKWSFEPATNPKPSLPHVLLIGDSICIGYKANVITALAGKANVDVWPHPMFQSEKLNQALVKNLKHGPYDVVHVNLGLHGVAEGRIKPGTYEPLTRQFIQIIRDTMPKAKIIWANTTQFTIKGKPTELDPVKNPTVLEHNRMAAKLMAEMNIPVNDFYGLLINKLELGRGDTVHWTPPAYQILADKATASILQALGQNVAANADPAVGVPASKPFVHPGLLHSREELEFIKQKVAAGEEPWKTAWEKLRASASASLDHKFRPRAEVVRGPYNNPNIGSSEFSSDSGAAYTHAVQWCLTGNEAHARKAIEILNAWSATLKTVSGHDTKLLIGMTGVQICNAAELLRHTYTGWLKPDQERFERLLREILYPPIKDFFPAANGNWDASMIQTMLAMGVFLDDRAMFDRAVDYYLKGEGNGAINNYFNAFGECQESGRDQGHTQMGLGYLGCACEIAWKQGVDLYGASSNRLALGFEYTAKYNLGNDVPYEPYRSFEGKYFNPFISPKDRGHFAPIYERIVYHYHGRKGIEMPYSRQVVTKGQSGGRSGGAHVPWGALMFAELPKVQIETK